MQVAEYYEDADRPIDHAVAWCQDARDGYVEAGEGDAARMVAAALVLLTQARVAALGAPRGQSARQPADQMVIG